MKKIIISIIPGALVCYGVFLLDKMLINWIVAMFQGHDAKLAATIVLWILAVLWTNGAAVAIGMLIGAGICFLIWGMGEKKKSALKQPAAWQKRLEDMKAAQEKINKLKNLKQ